MEQQALFGLAALARTRLDKPQGILYQPKGRAREYSNWACNLYTGCEHACTYCYVVRSLGRNEQGFVSHVSPRTGILAKLESDAAYFQGMGMAQQVLLSFTHDPYQPVEADYQVTRQAIQILHKHGMGVCTLSKGGSLATRDLDMFGPQDAYAATLTFLDSARSKEWEPGAALPEDRLATLKAFHQAGIRTWVSCEPVFDPAETLRIIETTRGYVDHYKIGTLNHHEAALHTDWHSFARQAKNLCERLGLSYYLKADLRAYLR